MEIERLNADNALDQFREHYLFSCLNEAEIQSLKSAVSLRAFSKGQFLFHRGDVAANFYFVVSGQIELSIGSGMGEKKVVEVVGKDQTFAEAIAFMPQQSYPVSAMALVGSKVCQIPIAQYRRSLASEPEASMLLLADVCKRLRRMLGEIEQLTTQNATYRLCHYLQHHLEETPAGESIVELTVPKHVIASMISVSPETLSRLLKNLEAEGVIQVNKRKIIVTDTDRLKPFLPG